MRYGDVSEGDDGIIARSVLAPRAAGPHRRVVPVTACVLAQGPSKA